MIGKYNWFKRRKYTGWGFSPKTWQGFVYIVVLVLPFILLTKVQPMSTFRIVLIVIWSIIVIIDFIDIMIHLPKDERDRMHEAISERNALWIMISVLALGIVYQSYLGAMRGVFKVDPIILIALIAGLIGKIVSNIYLDKKD